MRAVPMLAHITGRCNRGWTRGPGDCVSLLSLRALRSIRSRRSLALKRFNTSLGEGIPEKSVFGTDRMMGGCEDGGQCFCS